MIFQVYVGAEQSWITGLPARPGLPDVTVEVSRIDSPAHTIARELHEQAARHARASAGKADGRTTAPKETE